MGAKKDGEKCLKGKKLFCEKKKKKSFTVKIYQHFSNFEKIILH